MAPLFAEKLDMQISARPTVGTLPRAALAITAIAAVLGLAIAIAFDKTALGIEIAIGTSLPALLYVSYRWPIVFPFGLYVLSVPFDPLLRVGGGTGSTLTRFIGIAAVAGLFVHAYRLRRLYAPPSAWFAWAAYLMLCLLSLTWSIDFAQTQDLLGIMASLFALYTATAVYPISAKAYVTLRRTVVLAGFVTSLYGGYAYIAGQRLNGQRLSLSVGNVHFDSNHYAAFFCIPIGIVAARLFFARRLRERIFALIPLLAMFANVLLTGSRGGLIAATLLTLYIGLRARHFAMLAATGLGGLAMTFALPNVWTRFLDPSQGDASGRGEIWNVGFAIIREYGFIGCGFGSFPDAYNENLNHSVQRLFVGYGRPAHNILVQTTAELGAAGLILLLVAFWTSFRENAFIPRISGYFADRCAYEGAILGLFVCALTIDLLWFKYLWLCLTMIAMLTNAARPTILLGRRPAVRNRPQMAKRAAAAPEPARL